MNNETILKAKRILESNDERNTLQDGVRMYCSGNLLHIGTDSREHHKEAWETVDRLLAQGWEESRGRDIDPRTGVFRATFYWPEPEPEE